MVLWPPQKKLPLKCSGHLSSLLRWKNTEEIILNHKGTRMAKDGDDKREIPKFRESSFNMTRGDEDIEGGSENI